MELRSEEQPLATSRRLRRTSWRPVSTTVKNEVGRAASATRAKTSMRVSMLHVQAKVRRKWTNGSGK